MTNAIEKPAPFDPSATINAIRDRIRGAMLDIIPDEQWDALIKAEMHAFMNDTVEKRSYGESVTRPAGFKIIVREMLEEDAKKRLTAVLTLVERISFATQLFRRIADLESALRRIAVGSDGWYSSIAREALAPSLQTTETASRPACSCKGTRHLITCEFHATGVRPGDALRASYEDVGAVLAMIERLRRALGSVLPHDSHAAVLNEAITRLELPDPSEAGRDLLKAAERLLRLATEIEPRVICEAGTRPEDSSEKSTVLRTAAIELAEACNRWRAREGERGR